MAISEGGGLLEVHCI